MMFDEDIKQAITFMTDDTYVLKGTYNGDFKSGATITWDEGYDEVFKHTTGNTAVYIDFNGNEWDYEVCDVNSAQRILDNLKN